MSCSQWEKMLSDSADLDGKDQLETPSSIGISKSSSEYIVNIGENFKDILRADVGSTRSRGGSSSLSMLQQKFFCSVPSIVDNESGPINACLWDEDFSDKMNSIQKFNISRQDSRCDAERDSPRAVLEGPFSSGSPNFSRKSVLNSTFDVENLSDHTGLTQSTQKHCIQSLWRSFATRKWQSFPTSYRKKDLSISDPVLQNPQAQAEPLFQECVDDFLSTSCSIRRAWQTFSYDDISLATNNFGPENLVGEGGFAKVYKGMLKNGQLIAVKKLNRGGTPAEKERGFLIELGIVSHVSHINVAKILGICIENGLHLIFQLSTLGSLQPLLHCLTWETRKKVALGVARGLHYLHEQCQRRIIHRDIKASNILLDSNFEPQISDFGLSKWLPDRCSHHTVLPIEGTFGYLASEYFLHGRVDEKTDVFAYGVLLLELITGRRPVDSEKQNLVIWAKPYLRKGNVKQLADQRLDGEFDSDQMHRLVLIAGLCVRPSPTSRPSMRQVVQLLSEDVADKKSDLVSRSFSQWHDVACSDADTEEEYGSTEDYETDMQRHRALALEFE